MRCLICGGNTSLLPDPQIPVVYHVCKDCDFIFKDIENRVSFEAEEKEYDRHNNTMESVGYVNIFKNLIDTYINPLNITGKVLEFGSGPGPVLYQLLSNEGYQTIHFDPFYNRDYTYQQFNYQLITCTEVVEHFFDPMKEFKHLASLLEENGYLLIMTNFRNMDQEAFVKWWYRRDITHVSFYHENTLDYIAHAHDLKIIKHNNKNIILFQKK